MVRGEWEYIAMKQIIDSGGRPGVFTLRHGGRGVWLRGHWAGPGFHWDLDDRLVFRVRK